MSGTGHSNTAAPSRLTPIAQDQPIGHTEDGHPIKGSMYFNQMITRILAYLGQPGPTGTGGASGGNNLTVSEQLTNLTNAIVGLQQGPGTAAPGISGRLSIVEEILARMPWLMPRAPREPRRVVRIPAPPPLPIPLRELPGPPPQPVKLVLLPGPPVAIVPLAFGTTAHRPATATTGQMYFDTTLGIPIWWNGTAWVNSAGAPV